MAFQYSGFNRFISIVLILLIVFMCIFTVTIQADAFVLSATSSAVILTILAACGIYGLGSLTDADALVYDFQKSLSAEAKAELDNICDGFFIGASFRLGAALLEAVLSYCDSLPISNDYVTVPANTVFSLGGVDITSYIGGSVYPISEFPLKDLFFYCGSNSYGYYVVDHNGQTMLCSRSYRDFTQSIAPKFQTYDHVHYIDDYAAATSFSLTVYKGNLQLDFKKADGSTVTGFTNKGVIHYSDTSKIMSLNSNTYTSVSAPVNSTYLPAGSNPLTTDTAISVPQGLVNEAGEIDTGVLEGMTAEDVRVNDTATDVPEEGGFLASIAAGVTGIFEAITGFFDVSRFELDLSPLKIGLADVFPFCIPFDFFNSIKQFASPASDFTFDIKLDTEFFDIDHTVDLKPFRIPILFFRYVVTFWFTYILISKTRDFIKW